MKCHVHVWLCSVFYSLHLQHNSFNLNNDPTKIPILLQLSNDPEVWMSSRKATNVVSTSTDVLYPDPLSPKPSASSAMQTADPQSAGPSTSL
jgi:hypothetical protein